MNSGDGFPPPSIPPPSLELDPIEAEIENARGARRMLVVGGELIAVAKRVPGHVVGDGKHTIAELTKIVNDVGQSLPVPSAGCHQAIPVRVAQAVNYILQGVLTSGTAAGMELANYQAAGKTGTSNVANGNGTPYAAFAGYTTGLAGYVSVFNPTLPTTYTMTGISACYQLEGGGQDCPGEMFGANAPASTWHMTFDHADLAGSQDFQPVPPGSSLWNAGDGTVVKQPAKKGGKGGKGGNNNGNGNGNNGNGNGNNGNGNGNGNNGFPVTTP